MPKRDWPLYFSNTESAEANEGGGNTRLSAPAALRTREDIACALTEFAPTQGTALELASGTGEHVVVFARIMPGIAWQPTEVNAVRCASVAAHCADAALPNIHPPRHLDALRPRWSNDFHGMDLIHLGNLIHLITWKETEILVGEVAMALAPGGRFTVYGPFMRAGELTSPGDASFHAQLATQNPAIGYKDDFELIDLMGLHGLQLVGVVEMPANNLLFVTQK